MAENELGRASAAELWRVLVVEDEYYIADDLRRALEDEGAQIIGPVPTVERALALVAEEKDISVAILDVKLGDELVWPVVEALRQRGVDYVLATGYSDAEIPPAYLGAALFRKPAETSSLVRSLIERRKAIRPNPS